MVNAIYSDALAAYGPKALFSPNESESTQEKKIMAIEFSELVARGANRSSLPSVRKMCEATMLRGGGRGKLDDLETDQICALGHIVQRQSINSRHLGFWLGRPEEEAEQFIEALEEGGFLEFNGTDYSPTNLGEQVVAEIGEEIARTDRIILKGYIADLESLLKR